MVSRPINTLKKPNRLESLKSKICFETEFLFLTQRSPMALIDGETGRLFQSLGSLSKGRSLIKLGGIWTGILINSSKSFGPGRLTSISMHGIMDCWNNGIMG